MRGLLHDTVRRWLEGMKRPRQPEARIAWHIVRLQQRRKRREYEGTRKDLALHDHIARLWIEVLRSDKDWMHVIHTMMSGQEMRMSAIKTRGRYYTLKAGKGMK
jgi:hypothetical protein